MIRKETFEVMREECNARCGGLCYLPSDDGDVTCCYEKCRWCDFYKKRSVPTPEEFADEILAIYKKDYLEKGSEEAVHMHMDGAILKLLAALGYEESVYIFSNTPMWYA